MSEGVIVLCAFLWTVGAALMFAKIVKLRRSLNECEGHHKEHHRK